MQYHTGSKWGRNIKPASKYPVIYADRNTHVAMVISRGLPEDEVEKNCNLIAAAPEMLQFINSLENDDDSIPAFMWEWRKRILDKLRG